MSNQNFPQLRVQLERKAIEFNGYKCFIKIRPYNSGRIYMTLHDLEDGQQVTRVTLDIDAIPHIDNLIIVKSYSENKGLYEALLKAEVIKPCERIYAVGYEMAHVCFLSLDDRTVNN